MLMSKIKQSLATCLLNNSFLYKKKIEMNLRKSVFSLICAACISLCGVSYGQSIIELADDATMYTQQENGYVLKFDVLANSEEMDVIKNKVASLSDRLSLEVVSYVDSKYNVVFTVNHQNHAAYVHKMMRSCGFKSLNYKGENFELIKIIEILESYQ